MNIDDAIRHCYEIADRNEAEALTLHLLGEKPDELGRTMESCVRCAKDHRQLAEWLTELKELREKQKWIPCSEGSPEEDEEVLVTVYFHGLKQTHPSGWRENIKPSYYVETASKIGGEWSSVSDEYKVARNRHEVIAWKPLPSPYQPEDGFTKWAKSVADEHRKKGEIE